MIPLLLAAALLSSGDAIVARNIFCSGCKHGPADPPPAKVELELVSILHARDPRESAAVLVGPRTGGLYRTGARVGGAELVTIERRRVVLRVGGQLTRLELDAPRLLAGPPPIAPRSDEIRCTNRECDVDRELVKRLLSDPAPLGQWVRALPASRGGLQLAYVRPGTPIAQLGLESGDRLAAVNGRELGSVEDMLRLYNQLKNATRFGLTVERRGQRLTFDYRLR
jgi:type II secretion system protein C